MEFIAENTTSPVPKVYGQTQGARMPGTLPTLTKEYIEGDMLDKAWPGLSEAANLDVLAQQRAMLSELRELKGKHIGALEYGPAIVHGRFTDYPG